MKLIYQWMLAFFGVIMTTIIIVGIAFTQYSTRTAYESTWDQLEGYADVIEREAFKQGSQAALSTQFIIDSQQILSQQHVGFNFFNAENEMVYPTPDPKVSVKKQYWKHLKNGQIQRLSLSRDSHQVNNNKQEQLVVFKPVFYNNKLIYVIGVAAPLQTVKSGLTTMRKNLLIAFLLSTIGGILLSYVLARYQICRINRLRNATHLVAEGDFNVQIKNPGKDELDDLATDFNEMVHSLNESEKEIKRQEDRRRCSRNADAFNDR